MPQLALSFSSEDQTHRFGVALSRVLETGDCVLLKGPIGAGKSFLARAIIQARMGDHTDVPSPTFTLVQTYFEGETEIWHADLYRLGDTSEAIELGLIDAMDNAICLIEWPELLADLVPKTALSIELEAGLGGHQATLTYPIEWADRLKGLAYVSD